MKKLLIQNCLARFTIPVKGIRKNKLNPIKSPRVRKNLKSNQIQRNASNTVCVGALDLAQTHFNIPTTYIRVYEIRGLTIFSRTINPWNKAREITALSSVDVVQ